MPKTQGLWYTGFLQSKNVWVIVPPGSTHHNLAEDTLVGNINLYNRPLDLGSVVFLRDQGLAEVIEIDGLIKLKILGDKGNATSSFALTEIHKRLRWLATEKEVRAAFKQMFRPARKWRENPTAVEKELKERIAEARALADIAAVVCDSWHRPPGANGARETAIRIFCDEISYILKEVTPRQVEHFIDRLLVTKEIKSLENWKSILKECPNGPLPVRGAKAPAVPPVETVILRAPTKKAEGEPPKVDHPATAPEVPPYPDLREHARELEEKLAKAEAIILHLQEKVIELTAALNTAKTRAQARLQEEQERGRSLLENIKGLEESLNNAQSEIFRLTIELRQAEKGQEKVEKPRPSRIKDPDGFVLPLNGDWGQPPAQRNKSKLPAGRIEKPTVQRLHSRMRRLWRGNPLGRKRR